MTVVNDGWSPWAGSTRDSAGNLYGTTGGGGSAGQGVVFRLDPSGNNYTVLHMFGDGTYASDGNDPFVAGLTLDRATSMALLRSGDLREGGPCSA